MTSDSAGGHSLPDSRELFRVGETEVRFESIVHSLVLVLTAFVVGSVLVSLGNGLLDGTSLADSSVADALRSGLHFLGLLLVALWYVRWRRDEPLIGIRWPTSRDGVIMLVGSLALVATIVALDVLFSAVGLEPAQNAAVEAATDSPELYLYYVPVVVLLNAPAEEILFRGVVQGLFRRAYGIVPGILAAGLIFGTIHYLALVGSGSQMVYVGIAFVSGVILGALYEYSRNILVPIVMHAAWNCIVYINLYLQATGTGGI